MVAPENNYSMKNKGLSLVAVTICIPILSLPVMTLSKKKPMEIC